jgi:hypothetical protein
MHQSLCFNFPIIKKAIFPVESNCLTHFKNNFE